ncbi:hypothetical protein GCM10020256_32160 [Streptomyces thermocoprophilus]
MRASRWSRSAWNSSPPDGDVPAWAEGKKALVIGAGSMSSLAAATLARAGVAEIVVANRTFERAERLAEILNQAEDTETVARAVPMETVGVELTRADVAVSCTGATGLVLTAEDVAAAVAGRLPADMPPARTPEPYDGDEQARAAAAVPSAAEPHTDDENCPLDLAAVQPGFSVMGGRQPSPAWTRRRWSSTPSGSTRAARCSAARTPAAPPRPTPS